MMRPRGVVRHVPHVLLVVFLLALLLRVAFIWYHHHIGFQLRFDPGYYLALAEHMQHGVYSLFHPKVIPDTTRMPGYPFLIHLLGGDVLLLLLFQAALSSIKVLLVYRMTCSIGVGTGFALAAAVLMALEPMDILLSGQVLTESFFTIGLLAGCYLLLRGRGMSDHVLAGLCFSAATWFRPNGIWIAAFLCLAALLVLRRKPMHIVLTALVTLILVLPWVLRNQLVTGRPVLSDGGAVAAAYFHVPAVLQASEGTDPRAYRGSLADRSALIDWEKKVEVATFMRSLRRDIRDTWIEHPLMAARVLMSTSLKILVSPGRGHVRSFFGSGWFPGSVIIGWSLLFSAAIALALVGASFLFRTVPPSLWVLIVAAFTILLTAGISTPDARFKNPAMPLLLVVLVWVAQELRKRSRVGRPDPEAA